MEKKYKHFEREIDIFGEKKYFEREINIGSVEAAGVVGGTSRFKVEPLMEILMANNTSNIYINILSMANNTSNIYTHILSMANHTPHIIDQNYIENAFFPLKNM